MHTDEMRKIQSGVSPKTFTDEELKAREILLMQAFDSKSFQKKLKTIRLKIEDELKGFLKYLSKQLKSEQKIYDNVESRVKGSDSFREKIYRKDYVINWNIQGNTKDNQKLIATHLPDLIGFRITCFFWQDEENIYDILRNYAKAGNMPNIRFNFDEGTEQANGHVIHKLSGHYLNVENGKQEEYGFEVQIKGIMHNIWGEVEHKTIYKDRDFDPFTDTKKSITEEIFHSLHASNNQLLTLFSRKNDEDLLIWALFYERTKTSISNLLNTEILGSHYRAFVQVFGSDEVIAQIRKQVGNWLLGQDCPRLSVSGKIMHPRTEELVKDIKNEFYRYNLFCLYQIANLVYELPEYDTFLNFLADHLLNAENASADTAAEPDRDNVFEMIVAGYTSGFDSGDNDEDSDEDIPEKDKLRWDDEILHGLDEKTRAWKKDFRKEYKRKIEARENRRKQKEQKNNSAWPDQVQSEYSAWGDSMDFDLTMKFEGLGGTNI